MPSGVPIALGLSQSSGLEELGGAAPLSVNVIADATNAVRKRPGIVTWSDFPSVASGAIAPSEIQDIKVFGEYLVYVTADRRIHAWIAGGLVQELSDATAATQLDGSSRPVIIITKTRAIFSGGGAMQYWDGVSALSARLPGSPPNATHVVATNTRLVLNANDNTGQVKWSEAGELTGQIDWTHGNFLELEANPDKCNALYDNTSEVIGFGTKTTQLLVADPVKGFVTVRTLQIGMGAPYSFAADDDNFSFIDHLKRIQRSDGRTFKPISSPAITKTLKALGTVSDAWAFWLSANSWSLLVWVLPTEQRAFVYNIEGTSWSEWRGRSATGWTAVPFSSYCYFPQQDIHLVGTSAGFIKKLDFDAASDDGNTLHAEMVSGFIDHGNKQGKLNIALRFVFRTTPGTTPRATLYWRDNQGAWEGPVYMDVDETNIVEIRTLGAYRMRQYKLILDDEVPMSFVRAEEDFEQLAL